MTTATTKRQGEKSAVVLFRHDSSGEVQREFLSLLTEGYEVNVVGALRGCLVVERNHVWWLIGDNGGELNVGRINDSASLVSVASTAHGASVDGETMAYRVAMVLSGNAIDYGFRFQPAKARKQRGATKAQLAHRAKLFGAASPSIHDDVSALAVVR